MYIQVREDETPELDMLHGNCYLKAEGGTSDPRGKVNILLQSYISRQILDSFSLTSDLSYVAQVYKIHIEERVSNCMCIMSVESRAH